MKRLIKWTSYLLVLCMIVSSLPVSAFAESDDHQDLRIESKETQNMPDLQVSVQYDVATLSSSGTPAIKSTREVNWIDRLANLPSYATSFYNWLVENSDGDGQSDALIDPTAASSSGSDHIYNIVSYADQSVSFTYAVGASDSEIQAAAEDAVSTAVSETFLSVSAYAVAVYSAFDRDYPEVFWLSGSSRCSYSYSYYYSDAGDGTGSVNYDLNINFVLQSSDFDIRGEEYQNADTIRSAITTRNNAVNSITASATGTRLEQISYLNSWLTKNNCYNTSSDLSGISENCRNCIGALTGSTGTSGPVCEGYAKAFKVLCDALSIPCVLVNGTATNSSGSKKAHMWNYVQMDDDAWYAVDVTWNDPAVDGVTSAESSHEHENYLLVGSETLIDGDAFLDSHPVSNTVTSGGIAFTNGPELAVDRYALAEDEEVDLHETLDELTKVDYLAFSHLAYSDFDDLYEIGTIKDFLANKWTYPWNGNITYKDLYKHIAAWEPFYVNENTSTGFYAVAFRNNYGEVVLAYRGSESFKKVFSDWDAFNDWFKNDLPMIIDNALGNQFDDATESYEVVADEYGKANVVTTGHSLGGAWGDIISAYSGSKGITFNAVPALDAAYSDYPKAMVPLFTGIDKWNFVDQVNENDYIAGTFEKVLSNRIKPYVAYEGNSESAHDLESLVYKDSSGNVVMNSVAHTFTPNSITHNFMTTTSEYIDFGTSRNDEIYVGEDPLYYRNARTSYGGDGVDTIVTSAYPDVLVGGKENDLLDGRVGNDTYIYFKDHGVDTIFDLHGNDKLNLYGFSEGDQIDAIDNTEEKCISIRCNDNVICKIMKQDRKDNDGTFKVQLMDGDKILKEIDVSDLFKKASLVDKILDSIILFCCPVDIQILDKESNVVFTIEDGAVGSYYTDYGNFYVFKEANGGYGKILDLFAGYSVKIVGVDDGTMDISYQSVEDGELSEAITLTDVPVAADYEATLVVTENGEIQLNTSDDDAHTSHTAGTDWIFDETNHWHKCAGCEEIMDLAAHSGGTATCADAAICSVCGTSYGGTDDSNHTGETEIRNAKDATESEEGYTGDTYCLDCGELLTSGEIIPATHTHSYISNITAPTCTEQGYTTYTCECGDSYVDDYVDATGHSWNEGEVTKDPTPEAPGIKTFTCEICGETSTEEIPYETPETSSVQRVYGESRADTALEVAKAMKEALGVEKFDTIIIANGEDKNFADALTGSYLANVKSAPILMYRTSGLSESTMEYIQNNLSENGTIYLLGGESAIPASVEESLAAYTIKRLAGTSRMDTNLEILKEAGVGSEEILIARGYEFADSLSASATGKPILLVNEVTGKLTEAQITFLRGLNGNKLTILGGTLAISEELEAAIEDVVGTDVDRVYGTSREDTSVAIAKRYFEAPSFAVVAYSRKSPDGLCGGPLAYAMDAPLLLTNAGKEESANTYITETGIEAGYVLGGTLVITDETARAVFGLPENAVIAKK